MKRLGFGHTVAASHLGYVSQAIVNNLTPLLFLTFQREYGLSLELISVLVFVNFGVQLATDFLSAKLLARLGYRGPVVAAHFLIVLGLLGLALLPDFIPPFAGLAVAVSLCAVGGGLTEVLISPIVEACPTRKKSAAMSLLHSSYCWGTAAVILLSTGFFALFGVENWRMLACVWAFLPLFNALYFFFVPIGSLKREEKKDRVLLKNPVFWLFLALMFAAGAAELSVSQWASAFAEGGLGIGKAAGDIAGPCLFAVLMGISRVIHAKTDGKVPPVPYLIVSSLFLAAGYLLAALSPNAVLSLAGCGVCGFAVGALWPAVYSLAARRLPQAGGETFAYLALAGDLGGGTGPMLVGLAASACGDALRYGILFATVFPVLLCLLLPVLLIKRK